jgi:anti-anti-sigma factor
MPVLLKLSPKKTHIVHVEGPLRMPFSPVLRRSVRSLLRRGERRIVLDLSAVSKIDAAGVGELIRTFNMAAAVNGGLRIVNATGWVREILDRAQLFDLLSAETAVEQRRA